MDGEGEGDGGFVVECQRRSGSALLFGATYRALTRQLRVGGAATRACDVHGRAVMAAAVEPPVSDEVVDCDTQTLVSLLEMAASPRADTQLEGVRTLAALAAFPSNHSVLVASRQFLTRSRPSFTPRVASHLGRHRPLCHTCPLPSRRTTHILHVVVRIRRHTRS